MIVSTRPANRAQGHGGRASPPGGPQRRRILCTVPRRPRMHVGRRGLPHRSLRLHPRPSAPAAYSAHDTRLPPLVASRPRRPRLAGRRRQRVAPATGASPRPGSAPSTRSIPDPPAPVRAARPREIVSSRNVPEPAQTSSTREPGETGSSFRRKVRQDGRQPIADYLAANDCTPLGDPDRVARPRRRGSPVNAGVGEPVCAREPTFQKRPTCAILQCARRHRRLARRPCGPISWLYGCYVATADDRPSNCVVNDLTTSTGANVCGVDAPVGSTARTASTGLSTCRPWPIERPLPLQPAAALQAFGGTLPVTSDGDAFLPKQSGPRQSLGHILADGSNRARSTWNPSNNGALRAIRAGPPHPSTPVAGRQRNRYLLTSVYRAQRPSRLDYSIRKLRPHTGKSPC